MKRILAVALIAFLTACASTDFNQNLAAGYSANAGIRQSATTLLNTKQMSSDDGQNVLEQTDSARKGLDLARSFCNVDPKTHLCRGDLTTATNKLTAARAVLQAVQAYLLTKGQK